MRWGVPLATGTGSTGKNDRFALAKTPFKHVEDHLVVDDRVRVVHPHRIGAIVEYYLCMWYSLSEVGLCHGYARVNSRRARLVEKHTLNVSTPRSINASSLSWYHFLAAGFVTSTTPSPGCHKSHLKEFTRQQVPPGGNRCTYCHGVPSIRLIK